MELPTLNLYVRKMFPRHAVSFAKRHFNKEKITCAEIGTYQGKHAHSILKNLNCDILYCIDPYDFYDADDSSSFGLIAAEKFAKKLLQPYSQVIFLKEYSEKAVTLLPEMDFVYIDGNHNYDFVMQDIVLYWNKIRRGGIISGHDNNWYDVMKAVVIFGERNKLKVYSSGEDWWIVK